MVLAIVGIAILFLRMFAGDIFFGDLALKLVPIICALIVKQIVNRVASRIIFLNRKSKILALDNFRAYNIFLYFNFFFDCFMGVVSALIRLGLSIGIALIMIPSMRFILFSTIFYYL